MFSKSLYFAAECALVLFLNRARDFLRGNRCNQARHSARPCASARRPCGIPGSQCFWRRLELAFDRSSSAAATLRARSSISQLEQRSVGHSRKLFPLEREQTARKKKERENAECAGAGEAA